MHRLRDVFDVRVSIECGPVCWDNLVALMRELAMAHIAPSVRASCDPGTGVVTVSARVTGPDERQATAFLARALDRAVTGLEGRWAH